MTLILFLLILILGILVVCWIVAWGTHVAESIEYTYDWATYKEFLNVIDRENTKYTLKKECRGYSCKKVCYDKPRKLTYSDTIVWDEHIRCRFDTVEIDNKYIVFYPIDYLQYIHWMLVETKNNKRVKGLWKDVNQWDY